MPRRLAGSLLLLVLSAASSPAGEKAWTSDDVLALKVVSDPRVSPDGRLVAYVVESLNGEKDAYQTDVWLVELQGQGDALGSNHPAEGLADLAELQQCVCRHRVRS